MNNRIIGLRVQASRAKRDFYKSSVDCSDIRLIQNEGNTFVYYYNRPVAIFPSDDLFARNIAIINIYLNLKVTQETLSTVFGLSAIRIKQLVKLYRDKGMSGLAGPDPSRFSTEVGSQSDSDEAYKEDKESNLVVQGKSLSNQSAYFTRISPVDESGAWIPIQYAGAFLLFGFLKKMNIFEKILSVASPEVNQGSLIRLFLTLFFMNALRFKSIEQSKFIEERSFSLLIEGPFQKLQHLRNALDEVAESSFFPVFVQEFFGAMIEESLRQCEKLFYIDSHFSPYYGERKIPYGYDTKRQRGFPGRSTVFVHDESGKNVIFFESPTNNALHEDLREAMIRLQSKIGDLRGISLFFDRGGFSAGTFKKITQAGAYFTTFLKNRKKEAPIHEDDFVEVEIEVNHEKRKIKIHEKVRSTRSYGEVRIITFIGREGQQIPILTTEPTRSAAEIIERMKGRWKEENCFKFMVDHYAFDLMSTYKMIQAPEKLIERPNPERTALNREIHEKKKELAKLHRELSEKVHKSKKKTTTTLTQLRKNNPLLYARIDTLELQLLSLGRIRNATIPTTQTNLADDHYYVSDQKRRLLINLTKVLNYNCEKSLQELLHAFHPKLDETLAIIIQLIQQPGKIRENEGKLEVEVNRMPTELHARSCDQLIGELSKQHLLVTPFGTEIVMRQGEKRILAA